MEIASPYLARLVINRFSCSIEPDEAALADMLISQDSRLAATTIAAGLKDMLRIQFKPAFDRAADKERYLIQVLLCPSFSLWPRGGCFQCIAREGLRGEQGGAADGGRSGEIPVQAGQCWVETQGSFVLDAAVDLVVLVAKGRLVCRGG